MPETVLFESAGDQSRAEIASYLRTVAEKLEAGGALMLTDGSKSVTMDPPEHMTLGVKAEREGLTDGDGELSIEFEIEWDEGGSEDGGGQLEIE